MKLPTLLITILLAASQTASADVFWPSELVTPAQPNPSGTSTSLKLGPSGEPRIAYSGVAGDVRYASKVGATWVDEQVNSVSDGGGVFLALTSDDVPKIAYSRHGGGGVAYQLKYSQLDPGGWTDETIDTQDSPGGWKSIALDAAGNPGIAYHAQYDVFDLRYAKRGAAWSKHDVDVAGNVGLNPSLRFNSSDHPMIAYNFVASDYDIKRATANGPNPSSSADWVLTTEVTTGNTHLPSLALDSADNPKIAYIDYPSNDVYYEGELVDTLGDIASPHLLLFSDEPRLIYHDPSANELIYAHKTGASWSTEVIADDVKRFLDGFALDQYGRPHVAYVNINDDLVYAWLPEPATLSLLMLGGLVAMRRR